MTSLLNKQGGVLSTSRKALGTSKRWGGAPGADPASWAAHGVASPSVAPATAPRPAAAPQTWDAPQAGGDHPLQDALHNRRLLEQENEIKHAFDSIQAVMAECGPNSTGEDAAAQIQAIARARLGYEFPTDWLRASWSRPVNLRRLYAFSVYRAFEKLAARHFDRAHAETADGESASEAIRKWGFHAIDISACADGRMAGVVDYILRVPPSVVSSRRSFAGAMFHVEETVSDWAAVELRRHRNGVPNAVDEPTRYLKIGVYHGSGSDPHHQGCAAYGSDECAASSDLLARLNAVKESVEAGYGCGATVATLLVGVDTDTDAIKVHIPDANGDVSLSRYVDNAALYDATRGLDREAAKDAIRTEVARVAGVAEDDTATEGMRWFAAYLLKNNMAQIDYVRVYHQGRYADLGHTERFIAVGDSFDDVQLRNLSYQAQMATVEEGANDMDVGVKIFTGVNLARHLPIPVIVHVQYRGCVPGARDRAVARGLRLERAIRDRYRGLVNRKWLYTFVAVRDTASRSGLELIEGAEFEAAANRSSSSEEKG